MQSEGVRPDPWRRGLGVGAIREGASLKLYITAPARLQFDYARHRRVMNFKHNYVRLNEFPEWFTVDENRLYSLSRAGGSAVITRLGSELIEGIDLQAGMWTVSPAR